MNAPAYHPPRREDYEPNVRAFLPGVDGEELQLRASLLLMRDRAVATKPICSEQGWALLDVVERTASGFAFRSMPLDDLRAIRAACLKTVTAASEFDIILAPALDLGEPDDRG